MRYNRFSVFITILILLTVLVGCQSSSTQTPQQVTATITPVPTVPFTSTPSPSPAPTSTPTSTSVPSLTPEIPSSISTQLGVNVEGTLSIVTADNRRYLTSDQTKARYAVYENGAWRKLDPANAADLEMMYGHIVTGQNFFGYFNVSIPAFSIPSYHELHTIYLGEYEIAKVTYKGQEVRLPLLLTGMRSADEKLHLVKVAVETPDLEPKREYVTNWCYDGGSGRIFEREGEELLVILDMLKTGEVLSLDVVFNKGNAKLPGLGKQERIEDLHGAYGRGKVLWSNVGHLMLRYLYNNDPERITYEEAVAMEKDGEWPDRVVTIYNELGLCLYMPQPK
jgi:hypothetical protein